MSRLLITLACGLILLASTAPAWSHELVDVNGKPISTHEHVWRQQEYGTDYRQGHSVNNAQGNITVWSPNTYRGYNAGSTVRFARPVPMTGKSSAKDHTPNMNSTSESTYGTSRTRDNG